MRRQGWQPVSIINILLMVTVVVLFAISPLMGM